MNHAFFYYRGRQGVCALLTWYQDAPWEEGKLTEVVWCWETLSPAIYVDVTLTTTHLSIVADHVLPFMETVFPVCCGLLQQLLWLCGCLFIYGRDISKDMFTWLTQLYLHHPVDFIHEEYISVCYISGAFVQLFLDSKILLFLCQQDMSFVPACSSFSWNKCMTTLWNIFNTDPLSKRWKYSLPHTTTPELKMVSKKRKSTKADCHSCLFILRILSNLSTLYPIFPADLISSLKHHIFGL